MHRTLHMALYLATLFGVLAATVYVCIGQKEWLQAHGIDGMIVFAGGAIGGFYLAQLLFGVLIPARCGKCGQNSAYITYSSLRGMSNAGQTRHRCRSCDRPEYADAADSKPRDRQRRQPRSR